MHRITWTGLNVMPLPLLPYFLAICRLLPPIPQPTSTVWRRRVANRGFAFVHSFQLASKQQQAPLYTVEALTFFTGVTPAHSRVLSIMSICACWFDTFLPFS